MLIGLGIILLLTLVLPFCNKWVERNLEVFIFIMGLSAVIISRSFSAQLVSSIITNYLLYMITAAVFIGGLLFKYFRDTIRSMEGFIFKYIPLHVFIFLIVVILGLISSVITAIIASLLLVEIVCILPLKRKEKIDVDIIACFSIGLGAVLTPIGEPLATIVTSRLNKDFLYLFNEVGVYIICGIIALGLFAAIFIKIKTSQPEYSAKLQEDMDTFEDDCDTETYKGIIFRALKIFLFIIALDLLGTGFKPVIDMYIVTMNSRLLYFVNMISAILDNATLAAAEISVKMTSQQIQAVLMGLLISGGMLIPGNIPNIISAGKLKISSHEWARLGIPLGLVILIVYFVIIFVV